MFVYLNIPTNNVMAIHEKVNTMNSGKFKWHKVCWLTTLQIVLEEDVEQKREVSWII